MRVRLFVAGIALAITASFSTTGAASATNAPHQAAPAPYSAGYHFGGGGFGWFFPWFPFPWFPFPPWPTPPWPPAPPPPPPHCPYVFCIPGTVDPIPWTPWWPWIGGTVHGPSHTRFGGWLYFKIDRQGGGYSSTTKKWVDDLSPTTTFAAPSIRQSGNYTMTVSYKSDSGRLTVPSKTTTFTVR